MFPIFLSMNHYGLVCKINIHYLCFYKTIKTSKYEKRSIKNSFSGSSIRSCYFSCFLSAKSSQVVEEMPVFPGGEKALVAYLKENLKYPSVPAENGVQGRVIVLFKVEADGSLTDVRIGGSVDPSIDREALRLVKAMPKWIPGKQDGKPVPVKFQVSITFSLN